jgi:hypothetical protein
LAYAAEEADRDGRFPIDVEHLFRGILLADEEIATSLAKVGYTLRSLRTASKAAYANLTERNLLSSERRAQARVPVRLYPAGGLTRFWQEHRGLLVAILVFLLVVGIVYLLG